MSVSPVSTAPSFPSPARQIESYSRDQTDGGDKKPTNIKPVQSPASSTGPGKLVNKLV